MEAKQDKRTRFFVNTAIMDPTMQLSVYARLVYCFLSFCADKNGRCHPSVSEIARRCQCSVRKARYAVGELQAGGLIDTEKQFLETKNGCRRRASNVYILHSDIAAPPAQNDTIAPAQNDTPCTKRQGVGAHGAGEINNKHTLTNAPLRSLSMSAGARRDDGDGDGDADELERILGRICLDLYDERWFAELVEMCVREMYHARQTRIGREFVPRERVRERLRLLDVDCIDAVLAALLERGESVCDVRAYLATCLYAAPMEQRAAAMRHYAVREWERRIGRA